MVANELLKIAKKIIGNTIYVKYSIDFDGINFIIGTKINRILTESGNPSLFEIAESANKLKDQVKDILAKVRKFNATEMIEKYTHFLDGRSIDTNLTKLSSDMNCYVDTNTDDIHYFISIGFNPGFRTEFHVHDRNLRPIIHDFIEKIGTFESL